LSVEINTPAAYADAALFVHETVILLDVTFVALNAVGVESAVEMGTHDKRVPEAGRAETLPVAVPLTVLKLLS
jgi:hypothetical protein